MAFFILRGLKNLLSQASLILCPFLTSLPSSIQKIVLQHSRRLFQVQLKCSSISVLLWMEELACYKHNWKNECQNLFKTLSFYCTTASNSLFFCLLFRSCFVFNLKKFGSQALFFSTIIWKRLVIPEFRVSGHHLMHLSHYITFRSTLELRITSLHLCGWIDLECTGTTMYDIPLES